MNPDRTVTEAVIWAFKLAYSIGFFIIAVPLMLPFTLAHAIYSSYLQLLIKLSIDRPEMAANLDAIWMQDSVDNRAIINGVLVLRDRLGLEKLRELVQLKLVEARATHSNRRVAAKFQMIVTKRHRRYVWLEDETFNVRNHVIQHEGGSPGSQMELEEVLSEYCSQGLNISRSPWLIILVPTAEGGCVLLFRCHHVIGDGVSLTTLMMNYLVDTPPVQLTPVRFGSRSRLWTLVRAALEGPYLLTRDIIRPNDRSRLHGPQLSGRKRLAWIRDIQLAQVKRIRQATDTTVNDVLMSCLSSAFRRYFLRRGWAVPPTLKAYLPIDMRARSAEFRLDNQFSLIFLGLDLADGDPLKTLRKTRRSMNSIKASSLPVVNYLAMIYCMSNLPGWIAESIFELLATKSSLVLSNVPGPAEQLSVGKSPIETMSFWVPSRSNIGVGVSILSYNNQVSVGVITDTNVMEDPQVLAADFRACLDQLERAVIRTASRIDS